MQAKKISKSKKTFAITSNLDLKNAGLVYTLLLLISGVFTFLHEQNYESYYLSVQEDSFLEWATFWAFIIAGFLFIKKARKIYSHAGWLQTWFVGGVGIFCLIVAMEEISWGQRLLGYRPPEYFLENNFQQEFNFHNIVKTSLRKLALNLVIVGYGVVLPMLTLIKPVNKLLRKIGIINPPVYLIPLFVLIFIAYVVYPFKFTGEIVELLLGLGFLFSAVSLQLFIGKESSLKYSLFLVGLASLLSFINVALTQKLNDDDPQLLKLAETETYALHQGFGKLITGYLELPVPRCGRHSRVFNYFNGYPGSESAVSADFKALINQGLPEGRAVFYLDPWNSPYWVRDICLANGQRALGVYSFGPDRRRQSTELEIQGDDIGIIQLIR